MPASHAWKSSGSKRTISWRYEPSPMVIQYLYDMRDAVRNGVLKAEEMRRRNGKPPTPINLRKELKPWFYSQFDYAMHHINPVCQAAIGALKSHRKKRIKKPTPEINKLSMRLDVMLVRLFSDKLRVTIRPGEYEWISIIKEHKKWMKYSTYKISELLITDKIVAVSFRIMEKKTIAKMKVGIDLNFKNVTKTVVYIDPHQKEKTLLSTGEISTAKIVNLQNDFIRRTRKIQKRVKNTGKRNRILK